jgi:hypothetical protein
MTLATYRCLPEGGLSRPHPPTSVSPGIAPAPTGPHAAVDRNGRPSGRPRWLAGEYLALLERHGRGVGIVYLVHFDQPIGDLHNPRGYASHYTGWTLDLPARLVEHAAGRGARLLQVVGELGIGWQLARIWAGTRDRERSLKRSGGAARRCPVCRLTTLGMQPPRPVDPIGLELGHRVAALVPPLELPSAVAA